MGKKLDALLGRTFKTAKFKAVVNLAISRLAVLKNQRQVRLSQATSDAAQLLKLGHHERALLRVEVVIKEQNMLDVFVMIEGYCHILTERVHLIQNNRECPDELKEAISSLIFAASRCGEFPELQEIRSIFASRFGKEFVSGAVELRNHCGVNQKMIVKLSTRQPSYESRVKVLQEIASENGVTLDLKQEHSATLKENLDLNQNQPESDLDKPKAGDQTHTSESVRARKRYHDVASAAQAAFESAAYAADAARAAVELSRSQFQDNYSDGPDTPAPHSEKVGKIHPIENSNSDSESDDLQQIQGGFPPEIFKEIMERSQSASSEESLRGSIKVTNISSNVVGQTKTPDNMVFDESERDDDTGDEADVHVNHKSSLYTSKLPETKQNNASADSEAKVHFNRLNLERRPISVRARRENKW